MLLGPENGAQMDLPSSVHYIHGYFRIVVAFKSHIQVVAWVCINVFRTSAIGGLSCFYSASYMYLSSLEWDSARAVCNQLKVLLGKADFWCGGSGSRLK